MPKVTITDAKGLFQESGSGFVNQSNTNGLDLYNEGLNTLLLGLNPTWNENFGGEVVRAAGGGVELTSLDVLTSADVMLRQALALRQIAEQADVVSAAQAAKIFGVTANAGADIALGSATTSTNIVPATLTVNRLTGNLGASLTLDDSATDLASDNDQALIIFAGNVVTASQALTIGLHANNEMDAESCEFFTTTTSATNILEREAATTDLHQDIILTASAADTTIHAGSFIYLHASNATDIMTVKMCLLTSGGKITITTGN